jgi:ABC-type multidrug transport system ATPase subunit
VFVRSRLIASLTEELVVMFTLTDRIAGPETCGAPMRAPGPVRIAAHRLGRVLRDGTPVLTDVTLTVEPGELVAIVGASGAGKTTLLETLAGLRRPSTGSVTFDSWDVHEHRAAFRTAIGYVPQDDIIHRDLPVRATLRHAARLRLPGMGPSAVEAEVGRTMETLGLTARASTRVDALSGGQRKRVSIAVELLTRPRAFFLDEPTSGLDPGTARTLLATLRELADNGSTVLLTTHSPDDLRHCDRVVVLSGGGRLVFHGTPTKALRHFGVDDVTEIYRLLEDPTVAAEAADRVRPDRRLSGQRDPSAPAGDRPAAPSPRSSSLRQWTVLCHRNVDVLVRNRLTLAIMLGAPALVVAMFVVLFRPGAFDTRTGDPLAAVGITYWLAFAGFFFGLTYGLLQICTELAVVRRERHIGLGLGAYLLAKMTVLLPLLLIVNATMVAALRTTGRLPQTGWRDNAAIIGVLLLDAIVALALGLLASAAVTDPSHATLALPMLCFPAVLFGGAVLPAHAMATAGRAISTITPDRWAFEALGRHFALSQRFEPNTTGRVLSSQYGDAFTGGTAAHLLLLGLFSAAFLASTVQVLRRRTAAA